VAEVIRDVLADLAALATDRRASVQVEADDVSVRCSRSLLQTVLMNLVGNALKGSAVDRRTGLGRLMRVNVDTPPPSRSLAPSLLRWASVIHSPKVCPMQGDGC
jgi:hypothetical protein